MIEALEGIEAYLITKDLNEYRTSGLRTVYLDEISSMGVGLPELILFFAIILVYSVRPS